MWLLLAQHVMLPHPNLTPISSRATRPHPSNKPICHLCERTGDCTGSGIDCWHRAKTIKFIKWSVSVLLSLFCPCLTSTPSFSFPLPPRSFLFQLNQIFLYKCSVSSSEQPGFARRSPPLRFSSLIPWHLFKLRPPSRPLRISSHPTSEHREQEVVTCNVDPKQHLFYHSQCDISPGLQNKIKSSALSGGRRSALVFVWCPVLLVLALLKSSVVSLCLLISTKIFNVTFHLAVVILHSWMNGKETLHYR